MDRILQSEAAECGLASVAMVASHYGFKSDLVSLRKAFPQSLKGLNLQQVMNIADQLKLTSRALKLEMEHLSKLSLPCILHWDMNHFVVLEQVKSNKVVVVDPANGERTLAFSEFEKHFTGIALELTPCNDFEEKDLRQPSSLFRLIESIKGISTILFQLFLLSLVIQIFALASPYYLQLIIDDVLLNQDAQLLSVLAIGFFLITLFNGLVNLLRQFVVIHLGASLNRHLAFSLFHHLMHLPLDYFSKRHMGDIVSRFSSLQYLKELVTTSMVEAVIDGLMAITTLILIYFYNVKLAIIVTLTLILYLVIRLIWYRPLCYHTEQNIVCKAKEQSHFMESVRGAQTIKLSGIESKRQAMWQNNYTDALNKEVKVSRLQAGYALANNWVFGLENIIVIYLGADLILNTSGFSVGMLTAFIAYKSQLTQRFASLVEKLIEFKLAKLHFQRLSDITETKIEDIHLNGINHNISGEIKLRGINYQYAHAEPHILQDVNLTVPVGRSIAITGVSGSGKSTLLKLMLGLLTASSGKIYIDDIELQQQNLTYFRQQIAAVMQDDELLTGSIVENISQFEPQPDMQRIFKVAKQAAIHDDIINMPMDYNSLIGDMGATLSGGQKQRLLLARALYQQPKILFLDEATSHLDIETEAIINDAIKSLKITRIMIAHRPQTISNADVVYKLQNGELRQVEFNCPNN